MKKHIKKIICVVAILVACVSATIIPCFAYTSYMDGDLLGVQTVSPSFRYVDRRESSTVCDVTPSYIFSNSVNDVDSEAYVITSITHDSSAGNDIYLVYYKFNPYIRDAIFSIDIPTYKVFCDNAYYSYQFEFYGYYSFHYEFRHITPLGAESIITGDIDSSIDGEYWMLVDLFPSNWNDGVTYVSITDFVVDNSSTFGMVIPYYGVGNLDEVPLYPLTVDNLPTNSPIYIDEVDMGTFLWNSVNNFLNFEIVNGVSLYEIFLVIVSIPLAIWLLKLFAGG